MIFVLLGLLTICVSLLLMWPLLRKPAALVSRDAFDMEVHRDQLAEIERDLARGTITPDEARAARGEIGRRMLALADASAPPPTIDRTWRAVGVGLAVLLPLAALGLYGLRGSPTQPGQPMAERRAADPGQSDADRQLADFTRAMQERVAKNPDDLEAWVRLAQASAALNLPDQALQAWRRADVLAGQPPEIAGALGETAVIVANGQVTPEAEAAFARVLAADAGDPRARYYTGLARAQAGDRAGAVRIWFDLVAASPADAPWLGTVRESMTRTAKEGRIDLAKLRPSPGNPPAQVRLGPPQVAAVPPGGEAVLAMPDDERQRTIRAMVEGLAAKLDAQPDDLEGWQRLARAWRVLNEPDKALAAHARAVAIAPDRVDVLESYADALMALHDPEIKLTDAERAAMTGLLTRAPNQPLALWLLGQHEALAGNAMAATALWQRLLALLPDGSPARTELTQRIDKLKSGN